MSFTRNEMGADTLAPHEVIIAKKQAAANEWVGSKEFAYRTTENVAKRIISDAELEGKALSWEQAYVQAIDEQNEVKEEGAKR